MLQLAVKSMTYWNNKGCGDGSSGKVMALCMSGLGLNRRMNWKRPIFDVQRNR